MSFKTSGSGEERGSESELWAYECTEKTLRINILLHYIKKHYFIKSINQSQSIKTRCIYFGIYYIQ